MLTAHMFIADLAPAWNYARRFRWVNAIVARILIFLHEHAGAAGPFSADLRRSIERRTRKFERIVQALIFLAAVRRAVVHVPQTRFNGRPVRRLRMTPRALRLLSGYRRPRADMRARIEALAAVAADPEALIVRVKRRIESGFRRIGHYASDHAPDALVHLHTPIARPVAARDTS